jgi:hypothetical protein
LIDGIEAAHEKNIAHQRSEAVQHQDHARRHGKDPGLRCSA